MRWLWGEGEEMLCWALDVWPAELSEGRPVFGKRITACFPLPTAQGLPDRPLLHPACLLPPLWPFLRPHSSPGAWPLFPGECFKRHLPQQAFSHLPLVHALPLVILCYVPAACLLCAQCRAGALHISHQSCLQVDTGALSLILGKN